VVQLARQRELQLVELVLQLLAQELEWAALLVELQVAE
jgi:hypothetical protein